MAFEYSQMRTIQTFSQEMPASPRESVYVCEPPYFYLRIPSNLARITPVDIGVIELVKTDGQNDIR